MISKLMSLETSEQSIFNEIYTIYTLKTAQKAYNNTWLRGVVASMHVVTEIHTDRHTEWL